MGAHLKSLKIIKIESRIFGQEAMVLFQVIKTKPNLSLYTPYYAERCNEFAGPNSASQRQDNTATRVAVESVANR